VINAPKAARSARASFLVNIVASSIVFRRQCRADDIRHLRGRAQVVAGHRDLDVSVHDRRHTMAKAANEA
jgi:hypothetical protein